MMHECVEDDGDYEHGHDGSGDGGGDGGDLVVAIVNRRLLQARHQVIARMLPVVGQ